VSLLHTHAHTQREREREKREREREKERKRERERKRENWAGGYCWSYAPKFMLGYPIMAAVSHN
jgi:hypothetical protein